MKSDPSDPNSAFISHAELHPLNIDDPTLFGIPKGVKIYINPILCINCGLCAEVCPFGLPIQDPVGKYMISRPDLCTECSACKRNCPRNAIRMDEQEGCGCLWDVVNRKNSSKKCC